MSSAARPAAASRPRAALALFLDAVEWLGNKLPDQVTIFLLLGVVTLALSTWAAAAGLTIQHPTRPETIAAVSLLNREGLQWMLSSAVKNFVGFPPLGVVLVALLGIGIAERVGLFNTLLKALVSSVPRALVPPTIVFAGIMSNVASDAGYVILPPLAALAYAAVDRHPMAGICAAFAGVAAGFSANLLPSTLDPLLSGLTTLAARLIVADYDANPLCNYYFMVASTLLLAVVGWVVSVWVVEPRFGPWQSAEKPAPADPRGCSMPAGTPAVPDSQTAPPAEALAAAEKRGLLAAGVTLLVTLALMVWLTLPQDGVLRNPAATTTLDSLRPFFDSLVVLIFVVFLLPGLAYGIATGKIRSDRDASGMMSQTLATMGGYMVVAFFASQVIAWFNKSNLGMIIAINGAEALRAAHLTGWPLMVAIIVLVALFNIIMSSASAKWTLLAPVLVPMLMVLGKSPETSQALYRVGDSVTNCITPLNVYLPILLGFARRYVPQAGLGTLIAAMLPYSIAFFLAWSGLLLAWLTFELPLGPGAPLRYSASP